MELTIKYYPMGDPPTSVCRVVYATEPLSCLTERVNEAGTGWENSPSFAEQYLIGDVPPPCTRAQAAQYLARGKARPLTTDQIRDLLADDAVQAFANSGYGES